MEIAKITVYQTSGARILNMRVPARMAGATVRVEFIDPIWEHTTKIVSFRSKETRIARFDGTIAEVPREVLQYPGACLFFGICGYDSETGLQLPLIEVPIAIIEPTIDTDTDPSADPTLPIYAQLEERVEDLEQNLNQVVGEVVQDYLQKRTEGYHNPKVRSCP